MTILQYTWNLLKLVWSSFKKTGLDWLDGLNGQLDHVLVWINIQNSIELKTALLRAPKPLGNPARANR